MIEAAVSLAVTEPTPENIDSALALMSLAESLGIDVSLDKIQEEIYEALRAGRVTGKEAGALALKVGFAPSVLAAPEPDESRASSKEAIVS
jgi:hypothetical protein